MLGVGLSENTWVTAFRPTVGKRRYLSRGAKMLLAISALAQTACTAANDAADAIARDRAKTVVNGIVETRFPGVSVAPVTDCIIDAASAGEILTIAQASVTGVTQSTVENVLEIASRPEATKCIAQNGLSILTG